MPVRSDDPLRRVTLNLYEADCIDLENLYGHGWTADVRRLVHEHLLSLVKPNLRTLGDLSDDS